jgi:UDPglucose 6-dehydrogenase
MKSNIVVGFVGMTHLGLVSAVAAAEKGFSTICFDPDPQKIDHLRKNRLPVSEPQLEYLAKKNTERLKFTHYSNDLKSCDLIYVAPDVATDDQGKSDLWVIDSLLDQTFNAARIDSIIVILSQVPPGYTRSKQRDGQSLYYQVETLIFGKAIDRALFPERFIVGCTEARQTLPNPLRIFLESHGCPILVMRYESAELAKISINMFLVANISTANTLAELCENIGADWSEIIPALKLDKRIGCHAYLSPGLGIAGGNLERDLATVCTLADRYRTDAGVVRAWLRNSSHRKSWTATTLRKALLDKNKDAVVAVWGLSYKENTHSTKNSPSIAAITELKDIRLRVYDPVVKWDPEWHPDVVVASTALDALDGADALIIMAPWEEFKEISLDEILKRIKNGLVLDPYAVLERREEIRTFTLGRSY